MYAAYTFFPEITFCGLFCNPYFYLLWNIAIHYPIKYLPPEHPLSILDSITYFHVFQTSGQSPTVACFPFLTIGVFKIC